MASTLAFIKTAQQNRPDSIKTQCINFEHPNSQCQVQVLCHQLWHSNLTGQMKYFTYTVHWIYMSLYPGNNWRPHKKLKVNGRKSCLSRLMQPSESGNNSATLPIDVRGDTDWSIIQIFLLTSQIYVGSCFMSPLFTSVLFYYVPPFEGRKHVGSFCPCTLVRTAAVITLFGSARHYILKKAQVNTFWCIYSGSLHMN